MSVEALSWALEQETGDSTRKCILLILADVANRSRECWYGHKTLAERAECSPRTMRRHLAALVDQGLLTKVERHRKDGSQTTNLYRLNMPGEEGGQSGRGGGQNGRPDYPPGQSGQGGGHERPGGRSSVSGGTEPSLNRTEDSSASSSSPDGNSSDGASPDVENPGERGKQPPAGSEGDGDELTWGELAGWMRTEGCERYLYQGQEPHGPKGRSDPWDTRRDISIARQLFDAGEPPWLIKAVVERVPDLPIDPPVTMRLFWQRGQRQRWNELKGSVLKNSAGNTGYGDATKLQVEVQRTGTDG